MLSYRHGFHAGNFADCLKHITLTLILEHLTLKEKPVFYLDTHAGAGDYSLNTHFALKNREHRWGIDRLLNLPGVSPAPIQRYLEVVHAVRAAQPEKAGYPGSPRLAAELLRPIDRLQLHELHPTDFQQLEDNFAWDRRIQINSTDGLHSLRSALPPKERRGLIFIDPAYEREEEYLKIGVAVTEGLRRFASGIFAVWYPLLDTVAHARRMRVLNNALPEGGLEVSLRIEHPEFEFAMRGCGLRIINPPYSLAAQLKETLPWLATHLADGKATFNISEL